MSIIPPNNPGSYILEQLSSQSCNNAAVAEYSFVVTAAQSTVGVSRLIFLTLSFSETVDNESYTSISLMDMSGNVVPGSMEVYSYLTYSASALTSTAGALYLPWTNYTRSVGAYLGQTLTLRLVSSGCPFGGHEQRSYFDGYNALPVVTGINSNDPTKQLIIVPNPASEMISITNAENKEMQIYIYDLQGREVVKETNKNINISALEKGMYLIKAASENKVYSQPFIKD